MEYAQWQNLYRSQPATIQSVLVFNKIRESEGVGNSRAAKACGQHTDNSVPRPGLVEQQFKFDYYRL